MSDNIETVAAPTPEAPKLAPVPALKEPEPFLSEKAMYRLKEKTSFDGTHHQIKLLPDGRVSVVCLLNEYVAPKVMSADEFEAKFKKV